MIEEVFPLESSKYQIQKVIGRGATATVYAAKCLTNGLECAIKVIDLEANQVEIEALRSEVAFWSSCDHPNLVKYYGSFIEKSTLYIIMEYMDEGSIYEVLRFGFHHGIPKEALIGAILKCVLKALLYFHENRQIHRDVKAGNILVNKKGEIKLADFGIAAKLIEKGQRIRARFTIIGTPCYMAPEVLCAGIGYSEKADIWSLGITAIELATGSAPYSDLYPLEVVVRVSSSPPPTLPSTFSSHFRDFVKTTLQQDPSKRPTSKELMNHWFMKNTGSDKDLRDLFGSIPSIQEQYEITHVNSKCLDEKIQHKKNQSNEGIKADWNFCVEPNININNVNNNIQPNEETKKQPVHQMRNSASGSSLGSCASESSTLSSGSRSTSSSNSSGSEEENDRTEVVQKGKFKITKRSIQNIPSDEAIVSIMKDKIETMKNRIVSLRGQNRELNDQIDGLFGELTSLVA